MATQLNPEKRKRAKIRLEEAPRAPLAVRPHLHWSGVFGKLPATLGCWLIALAALAASPWETLENCSLETWDGNDGDSFLVKCPGLKTEKDPRKVFRLYFVDTPESEDSLPERLEVQREYWDLPDVQTVVKCGEKAKQFSKHFLSGRFKVHTRWESALGRTKMGRHYAVLSVDGTDLGYALVRNGLARVYGKGPDLDGLSEYRSAKANAWWEKLRQAEAQAKHERKGCWAYSGAKGARRAAEEGNEAGTGIPGGGIGPGRPSLLWQPGTHGRATVGHVRVAPLPAFQPTPSPTPIHPSAGGTGPLPDPMAAPTATASAEYPLEVTTAGPLYIYSLRASPSDGPIGRLRAGMVVQVLEEIGTGRVHVRFRVSTGEIYEGAARKADLGIP